MEWIDVKNRKPVPQDSPILAVRSLDVSAARVLHYANGWNGEGWYDYNHDYAMGLNENGPRFNECQVKEYWMPLPQILGE